MIDKKTHDWYESYEAPFLFRVNMSKLFCSFRVGLKSAFYGTSKFLFTLWFCEGASYNCPSKPICEKY